MPISQDKAPNLTTIREDPFSPSSLSSEDRKVEDSVSLAVRNLRIPSASQPSPYTTGVTSTPPVFPSSQPARSIGAGIHDRVQMVRDFTSRRLQKSARLSTIMTIIQGKCPICFIRLGQLHDHKPWAGCDSSGNIPNLWLGLKRSLKFEKFTYCYSCALPQDRGWNREAPECHRSFVFRKGVFCPWADFVYIAIWTLWHDVNKRALMTAKFSLSSDISYEDFASWIGSEEQMAGEYFKGLEVFLWFSEEWLSSGRRRVE